MDFIAIDFELAMPQYHTVCAVGICFVKDGKIIGEVEHLVKPPNNEYSKINSRIHNITAEMTENAPTFSELWETDLRSYFIEHTVFRNVFAHNANFDLKVLERCLQYYHLNFPFLHYHCTQYLAQEAYELENYKLDTICNELDIELKHHKSSSDARACAEIVLRITAENDIKCFDDFQKVFNIAHGILNVENHIFIHNKNIDSTPKTKTNFDKTDVKNYVVNAMSDANNIFYNKNVVVTGNFNLTRDDIYKTLADKGALLQNALTKTTNILIVGKQDLKVVGADGLSGKQEKRLKYNSQGCNIQEMNESEFMNAISS